MFSLFGRMLILRGAGRLDQTARPAALQALLKKPSRVSSSHAERPPHNGASQARADAKYRPTAKSSQSAGAEAMLIQGSNPRAEKRYQAAVATLQANIRSRVVNRCARCDLVTVVFLMDGACMTMTSMARILLMGWA